MPLLVAVADYNIAYLYYLRGEYTRSIELYRAAREDCRALGDAYREALCDLDQSEMYLELNLIEEGAHLARRAQKAFLAAGDGVRGGQGADQPGDFADPSRRDRRGAGAVPPGARSSSNRKTIAPGSPPSICTRRWSTTRSAAWTRRCELCQRALEFFGPSPLFTKSVLCQLLLARIHLDRGEREQAKRGLPGRARPAGAGGDAGAELPGVVRAGRDRRGAAAHPEAAYQAYLKAHQHLENLRSHLKAEEMKIAFLKDKLEVYEALVRMCLARERYARQPGDGVRLHRAGQIAQPGRPDRVPLAGLAGFAQDRARAGGTGEHAARRTATGTAAPSSSWKGGPPT